MSKELKLEAMKTMPLTVGGTTYQLCYPFSSVILAEQKTGRELKDARDWFGMPFKDLPAILEAGLSRFHPEVTPEQIKEWLDGFNPETCNNFVSGLAALAWPEFTRQVQELQEKARAGTGQETSPNAPSGDGVS